MKDNNNTRVSAIMHTEVNIATQYKKLKEKNWIVYYYLLTLSKYNDEEKHRYVYRNDFNISQASKHLGIGRSTFYDSLDKLRQAGLIIPSHNQNYYTIPIKSGWAQISKDLLVQLLGYSKIQSIDLLRTYLFCKIMYETYGQKEFTYRNLIRCLGHNETDDEMYDRVPIYLDLLEKWKLIYLNQSAKSNNITTFNTFKVVKVNNSSEILNERLRKRYEEKNNPYGLCQEEEDFIKNNV